LRTFKPPSRVQVHPNGITQKGMRRGAVLGDFGRINTP